MGASVVGPLAASMRRTAWCRLEQSAARVAKSICDPLLRRSREMAIRDFHNYRDRNVGFSRTSWPRKRDYGKFTLGPPQAVRRFFVFRHSKNGNCPEPVVKTT